MTTGELVIRPARAGEAAVLTALALRSKGHWGYDAVFMAVLVPLLTITEDDLGAAVAVGVLDRAGEPLGVYRLLGDPPEGVLEDLWLDPQLIGHGQGRRLFAHALETARSAGLETLTIEADPHARTFYEAMGAVLIGERVSESGRTLPVLRVTTAADRTLSIPSDTS